MNLSIAELARAVDKSEIYVRQHIHRKHLTAQKDGHNVSVAVDEAVRWACERGLSFKLPARASVTAGAMKERTARMTVLAWHAPGAQPRNLFTLIRHRRKDALGPWANESDKTWSSDDLGHELRLFSIDASLEHCQAFVNQIVDSGTLDIDGLEIHYALESTPRRHWAYRDDRPLVVASMRSPFAKHSAEIIEYWSFAAEPRKRWLEVLESLPANLPPRLAHLGFPLSRRPDRVGNLMIAGAEDAITCDMVTHHDRTLRFRVDANELLTKAYRATVWATHSGDEVLRREVSVTPGQTVIEVASDVDHIGFAIYRVVDGQCIDLMEAFLIMEVGVRMEIESGPTLHIRNRQGRSIREIKPAGPISKIEVHSDNDSPELDKRIRRQCLDRRVYEREAATRREGNFVRFRPDEFDQAVRYFVGLLRQDSDRMAPIYLADPYFMIPLNGEEGAKLYLDLFAATTGQPLQILCGTRGKNGSTQPWWSDYPKQITAHVRVRAFLRCNMDKEVNLVMETNDSVHERDKPWFHDRYLITPKREFIITNSFNGWPKDGVTFAALPYDVYRAEADQLWSIDIGSTNTDLLVRKIA